MIEGFSVSRTSARARRITIPAAPALVVVLLCGCGSSSTSSSSATAARTSSSSASPSSSTAPAATINLDAVVYYANFKITLQGAAYVPGASSAIGGKVNVVAVFENEGQKERQFAAGTVLSTQGANFPGHVAAAPGAQLVSGIPPASSDQEQLTFDNVTSFSADDAVITFGATGDPTQSTKNVSVVHLRSGQVTTVVPVMANQTGSMSTEHLTITLSSEMVRGDDLYAATPDTAARKGQVWLYLSLHVASSDTLAEFFDHTYLTLTPAGTTALVPTELEAAATESLAVPARGTIDATAVYAVDAPGAGSYTLQYQERSAGKPSATPIVFVLSPPPPSTSPAGPTATSSSSTS